MCIMEVRLGQRDSTIAQALAHNTGTILADIELFRPILKARAPQYLPVLDQFQAELSLASRTALQLWATLVEAVVAADPDTPHSHSHEVAGNERDHVYDPMANYDPMEESRRELIVGYPLEDPQGLEAAREKVAAQDMHRAASYETRK